MKEQLENTEFYELASKSMMSELSDAESKLFNDYLKDPHWENEYQSIKKVWDMSENNMAQFDAEKGLNKVNNKILENKKKSVKPFVWGVAATVALLLIPGYFIMKNMKSNDTAEVVETVSVSTENFKEVQNLAMADSSKIDLNVNSKLTYDNQFGQKNRNVTLTGSGIFDIVHNPGLPFVINTNGVKIKVLGTKFYVNNSKTGTEVGVLSGKVEVSSKVGGSSKELIVKGEKITFDKTTNAFKKSPVDKNDMYWKTKELSFTNATWQQLSTTLSKAYSQKIVLDKRLMSCDLGLHNSPYKNEQLDTILEGLKALYSIDVSKQKGLIFISGSCE